MIALYRMRPWILYVLAVGTAAGCAGSERARVAAATVRDSAGIEIVESSAPGWTNATRWVLDSVPIVDLGASASDTTQQFTIVRGVHRLGNGTIAVFDAGISSIRFYDTTGALMGAAGRQGTGPGEFPRSGFGQSLSCGGDTLFVAIQNKLAAFAPPAGYARELTLPRMERVALTPAACHGSRLLASYRTSAIPTEEGRHRDSVGLALLDLDGTVVAVLDTIGWWDTAWIRFGQAIGRGPAPFGRVGSAAMGPGGVATTVGDRFEIDIRDTSGVLRRTVRVQGREAPLTDADLQRFREIVMPSFERGPDDARLLDRLLARDALPATKPAIAVLRFDAAGNLWVRAYDMSDATEQFEARTDRASPIREPNRRWTVLDSTGRLLGDIDLPSRFDIHQIGDDWLLGVWRDSLDVEHVQLYRLRKPAA